MQIELPAENDCNAVIGILIFKLKKPGALLIRHCL